MGVGPWFFNLDKTYQRSSVLLHEASHVLYNHFVRFEAMPAHPHTQNLAGDFEINTGLEKINKIDLEFAVFPDREPYAYPSHKSLEQYLHYLSNDPDYNPPPPKRGDSGEPQDGDGQGSQPPPGQGSPDQDSEKGSGGEGVVCDQNTDERSEGADEAGVEKASAAEQSIAKKNTAIRTAEESKKARAAGDGTMAEFLEFASRNMQPPKVDWRTIFRKVISSTTDAIVKGKSDYSYRRVSRRMNDTPYIFPGMVTYAPKVMFGVDTSGSMSTEDHRRGIQEIEGIIKAANRNKGAIKVFSIDTQVQNIKPVNSVEKLKLQGGGGTAMDIGVDYCNQLPRKDKVDIFILATDGYTNWNAFEKSLTQAHKNFSSIVLITQKGSWDNITPGCRRMAHFIDISED
jgi:predicted metal-dependent peptidase